MRYNDIHLDFRTWKKLRDLLRGHHAELFIQDKEDITGPTFTLGGATFRAGMKHLGDRQIALKPLEEYGRDDFAMVDHFEVVTVPQEIVEAAETVSMWFKERNIQSWQLLDIEGRNTK